MSKFEAAIIVNNCYPYIEDDSLGMVYKGNDFPCYLCGEPMDDEEGEVHWLCDEWEISQEFWGKMSDSYR